MIISEVVTLFFYAISMAFLPEYFGTWALCAILSSIKHPLTGEMFSFFLLFFRPHVCRLSRLCLEDSGYRGYQHYTPIYNQTHQAEGCASSLE